MADISKIALPNGTTYDVKDAELRDKWLLTTDEIPGATQTVTYSNGSVSQVTYTVSNETKRTDVFTYATGSVTEVRTLDNGASITIVLNTSTYATTVTYTPAS